VAAPLRVQGSGKLQANGVTGTSTFAAWPGSDFIVGNGVIVVIAHYANPSTDLVTGVTINGTAATLVIRRSNPTNPVNQIEVWWLPAVVTGGARSVAVTFGGAGAPDGHYVTLAATEISYSGTIAVVAGALVSADGNSTAPAVTFSPDDFLEPGFVVADGGTRTITQPASYTAEFNEGDSNGFEGGAAASRVAAASGSQTATWAITAGGACQWSAVSAVFRVTPPAAADVDTLFFGNTFL
jgi:hypothetical protein